MGRRRNRKNKRSTYNRRITTLRAPLTYVVTTPGKYVTTVQTLQETFDRDRPFRISALRYEACSDAKPFIIQFQAFGPVSKADNTWCSPLLLVGESLRRGHFVIPPTVVGWYPSDTAVATPLMQLVVTCEDKTRAVSGLLVVYADIQIGDRETDGTCPAIIVRCDASDSFVEVE